MHAALASLRSLVRVRAATLVAVGGHPGSEELWSWRRRPAGPTSPVEIQTMPMAPGWPRVLQQWELPTQKFRCGRRLVRSRKKTLDQLQEVSDKSSGASRERGSNFPTWFSGWDRCLAQIRTLLVGERKTMRSSSSIPLSVLYRKQVRCEGS